MTIDWSSVKNRLSSLSDEDQRIVDMLAERRTRPEIAQALGQPRSMIWRKVQRIKAKLAVYLH